MTVKSLTRSAVINNAKYSSLLVGNEAYEPSSDILISEQILASDAASVIFSSIPAGYTQLQIRLVARSTAAAYSASASFQFNSDTGTNYARHELRGDGTSATSSSGTTISAVSFATIPAASATTSAFGAAILDIVDYANTSKYTTTRSLAGMTQSAGTAVHRASLYSGLWLNTAAVSTITLTTSSNFLTGSRFSLYGVKG